MRKWCPEPFDVEAVLDDAVAGEFVREGSVVTEATNTVFESDPGFGARSSLWDMMNETERAELLERARDYLRPEFEQRELELQQAMAADHEELRAAYDARFDIWTREFAAAQDQERESVAADAAGLALALARKIIRDTVEIDSGVMVRTLETALYKIRDAHPLTVVLNPEEALALETDPGLKSRLRVVEVIPDRRIEKGGCRVRAGGREWDATISRQLDNLSAVVEEAVEEWETISKKTDIPAGGDADASGLG
jgi:flagellar biosynthesis/type III secretory pathway protein FliH